jgi:argininosuccinate lyase
MTDRHHRMHEFNQSLKYDKRMYKADIKGSIAFSKALLKAGILNEHEQSEITRGLKEVESEWESNKVCWSSAHEEVRA